MWEAAEQHAAAFGVGIEVAFAWLSHRDENSGAGALVPGIGEAGKGLQPGPQAGQDQFAGGGDVVGAARQDAGGPQRDAGWGDDALDEAGVLVCLTGIPFVNFRPLPAGFLVRAAAKIDLLGNRHLVGTVRDECQITRSAEGNMSGADDISLVVGRVLSETKFDLVVAGYRTPPFMVAAAAGARTFDPSSVSGNVLDLLTHAPHLKVPQTSYLGISEEEVLSSAIGDTLYRFKEAVENQGGWKNLYDDSKGSPAPETRHQSLFRLFGTLSFEMFGIQVMPNADHGSGQTDLTLVLGDAIQIVEFKKDHDQARLVHGLTRQLPKYMRAARTTIGWYFIMCHDRDPEEVCESLASARNQIETQVDLKIDLLAVDCRRRQSASKL